MQKACQRTKKICFSLRIMAGALQHLPQQRLGLSEPALFCDRVCNGDHRVVRSRIFVAIQFPVQLQLLSTDGFELSQLTLGQKQAPELAKRISHERMLVSERLSSDGNRLSKARFRLGKPAFVGQHMCQSNKRADRFRTLVAKKLPVHGQGFASRRFSLSQLVLLLQRGSKMVKAI